jgi:cytoskeleton protein RodZ
VTTGEAIELSSEHGSRRTVLIGVVAVLVGLAVLGTLATRSDDRRAAVAADAAKLATPPATALPAADAPKPEAVQPPQEQPAPPPLAAVMPAAPAPADGLRLSFREQAWVEVTQSDGRVVLSQLNEPGTEQRIEAKGPLRVVIGNASSVSLDYKGKPVDLKSATNADNVARITLN